MNWDIESKQGMRNAVEWLSAFVNQIKDGGMWAIPRSGSGYKILHSEKRAVRITESRDKSVERVFKEMGWSVDVGPMNGEQA